MLGSSNSVIYWHVFLVAYSLRRGLFLHQIVVVSSRSYFFITCDMTSRAHKVNQTLALPTRYHGRPITWLHVAKKKKRNVCSTCVFFSRDVSQPPSRLEWLRTIRVKVRAIMHFIGLITLFLRIKAQNWCRVFCRSPAGCYF